MKSTRQKKPTMFLRAAFLPPIRRDRKVPVNILTIMAAVALLALTLGFAGPAGATAVPIINAGFEDPVLANGAFTVVAPPGWSGTGGAFNPTTAHFSGEAAEGANTAYSNGGTLTQTLAAVLTADTRYELTVAVGDRLDTAFPGYSVQLGVDQAGTFVLLAQENALTPNDGFLTSTVTYTARIDDPNLGAALRIQLVSAGGQTNFDDVQLLSDVVPIVAAEHFLVAKAFNATMPDSTVINMWGFAVDADGDLTTDDEETARAPGPWLAVPPGATTLTIHLRNDLSVPISLVIPGQAAVGTIPVTITDGQGRTRVRSFTDETAPAGTHTYTWNLKPGTFLYQSGTQPSLQVAMGLYGAFTADVATGEAYPGVTYDHQILLLHSEIDPTQHATPANATPLTYKPEYFLINGQPFDSTAPPYNAGEAGQQVLIRLLNAGLKSHIPLLYNGGYMDLIAEDGNPYPYAREQYSAPLPPGKTIDALWTPAANGIYPLFDRSHHLTSGGMGNGGMLAQLQVGAATTPVADTVTILRTRYNANLDQLRVWATSDDLGATLSVVDPNGGADVPMIDLFTDPDVLNGQYYRLFVASVLANPGTATVDSTGGGTDTEAVAFTEPPVANDDAYAVDEGATLNVAAAGVLANDLKGGWILANNDIKAVVGTLPGNGTLTLNDDGSFSYTHDGSETLFDTFTYQAQAFNTGNQNNLGPPSDEAIVTITINPLNDPPVAIDDAATTDDDTAVVIDVLANDTDAEDDPLTVNSFTQGTSGTVAPDVSGGLTYTPTATGEYVDTFTYDATDGTDVSNMATVTVTVTATANQPPVAVNDFGSTTACDNTTVLCADVAITIDVVANDFDPDGTIDPTSVCVRFNNCANANPRSSNNGGLVTNNFDGTITYQPPPGYLGTDNFRYQVDDDNGATSNRARVRINVVQ